MLGQIIVTLTSAGSSMKHLSRFPCGDVREAFDLSQRARQARANRFQNGASRQWRKAMKKMSLTTVAIAASTFACAALLSFGWSEQRGLSLSVEKAEARVGRPLTPVSVAGVARRQNRRAGYGYGAAGAIGTAAAVGTAAAIGSTSPYYAGGGWGSPYYGGPVRGASAAYYGGYAGVRASPVVWQGGVSSSDHALYILNLHDSGYDTKNNFNASGNVTQ
jgi:hypothetical protein